MGLDGIIPRGIKGYFVAPIKIPIIVVLLTFDAAIDIIKDKFKNKNKNMSLPTNAIFYKDERIVGIGFCNPGWFISKFGLRECIIQSMDDAWLQYDPKIEQKDKQQREQIEKYRKEREQHFTTEDDLMNFDYLEVFDIRIPRNVAFAVYFNQNADEIWEEFCNSSDIKY